MPGRADAEAAAAADRRVDALRGPDAPINLRPTMTYAEAVALRDAGKLGKKPVLTELGWVHPGDFARLA